ncbi:hypothetical protein N7535_000519 [Penicillium sp. DV-2018c]|nr:hypothetical protein N7461_006235 [Penicillium sp. DV-2018c]KAJ5581899.1 hypothetical protein N7535_000519 [Penicillium sp. DV-2018c]
MDSTWLQAYQDFVMSLSLVYRVLIWRILATIAIFYIRMLCIFQGLKWFHTCPVVAIDDEEEITMFCCFGKILSTLFSGPLT